MYRVIGPPLLGPILEVYENRSDAEEMAADLVKLAAQAGIKGVWTVTDADEEPTADWQAKVWERIEREKITSS